MGTAPRLLQRPSQGLPRHARSNASAPVADSSVEAAIPVLPTVVVHPDIDEPILLPLVTVTPSASELAAARALDVRTLGTGAVVVALHAVGGGMAPRSGLDMPYYSFGKSVYRLRKE